MPFHAVVKECLECKPFNLKGGHPLAIVELDVDEGVMKRGNHVTGGHGTQKYWHMPTGLPHNVFHHHATIDFKNLLEKSSRLGYTFLKTGHGVVRATI